jgi:hypothetical protein
MIFVRHGFETEETTNAELQALLDEGGKGEICTELGAVLTASARSLPPPDEVYAHQINRVASNLARGGRIPRESGRNPARRHATCGAAALRTCGS